MYVQYKNFQKNDLHVFHQWLYQNSIAVEMNSGFRIILFFFILTTIFVILIFFALKTYYSRIAKNIIQEWFSLFIRIICIRKHGMDLCLVKIYFPFCIVTWNPDKQKCNKFKGYWFSLRYKRSMLSKLTAEIILLTHCNQEWSQKQQLTMSRLYFVRKLEIKT